MKFTEEIKRAAFHYCNLEYQEGVRVANPDIRAHIKTFTDAAKWGMNYEAHRHNSASENLWQSLNAFRIAVIAIIPGNQELAPFISLVDQCLIENKPTPIIL